MSRPPTRQTIQAIVNIFETGSPTGDYARVAVLQGDAGHLTYGRSQTTLGSGNLFFLIRGYCDEPGATHARALRGYLDALEARDVDLDDDRVLHGLLRDAGEDVVMRSEQDAFFDRRFWTPAVRAADAQGITTPLGLGVVYDSHIHGSWRTRRDETESRLEGREPAPDEREWVRQYVDVRRTWLLSRGESLSRTVYRMDAFRALVDADNWDLELPFWVRGVWLDESAIGPDESEAVAEVGESPRPILRWMAPDMDPDDVRVLQESLRGMGREEIVADGLFGRLTDAAVRSVQTDAGLHVDGVVGPATWEVLV